MENPGILTLHPEGKKGVNIPLRRYETMRDTVLGILADKNEVAYKELGRMVEEQLKGVLDGSIPWLMETVKLDLIARGLIRKSCNKPVRLQIVRGKVE